MFFLIRGGIWAISGQGYNGGLLKKKIKVVFGAAQPPCFFILVTNKMPYAHCIGHLHGCIYPAKKLLCLYR